MNAVVLRCIRIALFLAVVLLLSRVTSVHAQSCATQLKQSSYQVHKHSVNAASLAIPEKAWKHFEMARRAALVGRSDDVQREGLIALSIAPRFAEVHILLAAQQVHERQYVTAIDSIASARAIDPKAAWSSVVLASALTGLGKFAEAAAELDRARGAETETWQFAFERARASIGERDSPEAMRWTAAALQLAPSGCSDVHLLRANALQLAERQGDAADELQTWLSSGPHPEAQRQQVLTVLERTRARSETLLLAAR